MTMGIPGNADVGRDDASVDKTSAGREFTNGQMATIQELKEIKGILMKMEANEKRQFSWQERVTEAGVTFLVVGGAVGVGVYVASRFIGNDSPDMLPAPKK